MSYLLKKQLLLPFVAVLVFLTPVKGWSQNKVSGSTAPHYGVYELTLQLAESVDNPFIDVELKVTFTRPDGSRVKVDGFYDGEATYKARAYCDKQGKWSWRSKSNKASLNDKSGTFTVDKSSLKGKLRKHPKDNHQFAYDNGDYFVHVGDTGYRYVNPTEPFWKRYIDQASKAGFTKIRTWFSSSRHNVEGLWNGKDRKRFALDYWQGMEERIDYALNNYPHIQLQLIPLGQDEGELKRYNRGDAESIRLMAYAQARFSSYPNVHWCISNDRDMARSELRNGARKAGADAAAREPWGTLITNHQRRGSGYAFQDEDWSDIVTLEDMDEVDGAKLVEYRKSGKDNDPVVNDEDRYEHWRNPQNDRYFFRRLMWGSLTSGGHATYGGCRTWEAYDGKKDGINGMHGYYDLNDRNDLQKGAHDFNRIHTFFKQYDLNLVGMAPDHKFVGKNPTKFTCIRDDERILVYLHNPSANKIGAADEGKTTPSTTLKLPLGTWHVDWFDPYASDHATGTGASHSKGTVNGGPKTFTAPGEGDWLLLLRKKAGKADPATGVSGIDE